MTTECTEYTVVHILHQGRALCGLVGTPSQWTEEHRWVPVTERYKATCDACCEAENHLYDDG